MRYAILALLVVATGCGGGDDTAGPSETNFSGTYQGQYYAIVTSTVPIAARDSLAGGPVTLTLARSGGENYELSISQGTGGFGGDVTVNSAGIIAFPNADEEEVLSNLSSALLGICNLNNASVTPQGNVTGSRITVTISISGALCDYSGNGSDVRATLIQYTFTGTR